MILMISKVLSKWASIKAIKVVIVQGSGNRAFCAGGDIRSLYESGLKGDIDFIRNNI